MSAHHNQSCKEKWFQLGFIGDEAELESKRKAANTFRMDEDHHVKHLLLLFVHQRVKKLHFHVCVGAARLTKNRTLYVNAEAP